MQGRGRQSLGPRLPSKVVSCRIRTKAYPGVITRVLPVPDTSVASVRRPYSYPNSHRVGPRRHYTPPPAQHLHCCFLANYSREVSRHRTKKNFLHLSRVYQVQDYPSLRWVSVRLPHPYPELLCVLYARRTIPGACMGTTSIPVPDTFDEFRYSIHALPHTYVSSVRNSYPTRSFCDFCGTIPGVRVYFVPQAPV